ncbi:MAG: hypothetical protein CM15mP121_3160 [Bacteroidota bacterium]|nr:MAG: hypothetical protein CM15mP121_3160 [Bacteroidota bacterium]
MIFYNVIIKNHEKINIYFKSKLFFWLFSKSSKPGGSSVKWTGVQLSGKTHYGTLAFESADLSFSDEN